ncbi:MAG: site-specific DNA-methyltransferase [Dehalococcoidia bacterium]|nr:site-specific DNA-methyltransferase [Dehalococcoidia bacterium]
MKTLPDNSVDAVITDPPYPNKAGHFDDGVQAAIEFMRIFTCNRWFIFWDEMAIPPSPLPLVARHIWHRSNSNRPDNYEAIYEFCSDGKKKASRVFSFPVIYPGLTGCIEATGHPTQKNQKMVMQLIDRCKVQGTILDPFMGSGTTSVACVQTGRDFMGIEIDPGYFAIAERRIKEAQAQGQLIEAKRKSLTSAYIAPIL